MITTTAGNNGSSSLSVPSLRRQIGLWPLVLFGVGDILGAGIYGLTGKAAGVMGNAVWLAFLASMVAASLTGLSYAAVGSRFPRAGGAADVVWRTFRSPFLAFFVGLASLASGLTSMAAASRIFSGYLNHFIPSVSVSSIIFIFSLLLALIVFWGIKESLMANTLCTLIELCGLLLIIVVGLPYLGSVDYLDASTATIPTDINFSLIFTGSVLTFYSFIGFEDMLNVSEEVKSPQKTFPRALLISVAISSVVYLLISLIAVSVVPAQELSKQGAPLVYVVQTAAPWFPARLYNVIALFAVANTALLNFVMGSRLLFGMGRVGLLPSFLSRLHPTRQTPHIACGFLFLILLVLAYSGDISALAKATSILLLSCFMVVDVALVAILKKEKSRAADVFTVPVFVPILGALVCGVMLAHTQFPEWKVAGSVMAVIILLYAVLRPSPEKIQEFVKQ